MQLASARRSRAHRSGRGGVVVDDRGRVVAPRDTKPPNLSPGGAAECSPRRQPWVPADPRLTPWATFCRRYAAEDVIHAGAASARLGEVRRQPGLRVAQDLDDRVA